MTNLEESVVKLESGQATDIEKRKLALHVISGGVCEDLLDLSPLKHRIASVLGLDFIVDVASNPNSDIREAVGGVA